MRSGEARVWLVTRVSLGLQPFAVPTAALPWLCVCKTTSTRTGRGENLDVFNHFLVPGSQVSIQFNITTENRLSFSPYFYGW